jgi:hypothetical protein
VDDILKIVNKGNNYIIMELSKIAKQLGKKGGKKSVEARFGGKSKQEISEMMRKVRYSKKELQEMDEMDAEFVKGLNEGAKKD